MDTSDQDIDFDNRGFCNHCRNHYNAQIRYGYDEESSVSLLERQIDGIKRHSRSRPYDCILGVSGGVDSSYAAVLAKEYGLRVLLIHVDNGWNTEVSVRNISTLVSILNFDYISEVIDWASFREVQLAFLRSGSVDLEMPTDIAIFASIYKAAIKHRIKYIISGSNLASEGMLPLTWGYHRYKDMRYYRAIAGRRLAKSLKRIPHLSLPKEIYVRLRYKIKTLYLLNYIKYSKDDAKAILESQFGWRDYGGKHHESRITGFWQGFVMPTKFGFDYRRPTLSAEICTGRITRDAALRILEEPPSVDRFTEEEFFYIAKKFGITKSELQDALNTPPRSYKDFRNSKTIIDFVHNTYRRFVAK